MTPVELVSVIGDVITDLDTRLSDPNFNMSDPNWQALYALRKHLDDLQRALVQATIESSDATYQKLTEQISDANDDLQKVIDDISKVDTVIQDVSKIASFVDQILKAKP